MPPSRTGCPQLLWMSLCGILLGRGACSRLATARSHGRVRASAAGARPAPPRARTAAVSWLQRRQCWCGSSGGTSPSGGRSDRVRGRARRRRSRRDRRGDRAVRQPAHHRAQGVRLVHVGAEIDNRSQRATVQLLEQPSDHALACRMAGGEGASAPGWRRRKLRALVPRAPHDHAAGAARAQPLPRDARRARPARARAPALGALALVGAVRMRRHSLVPVACAAYAV